MIDILEVTPLRLSDMVAERIAAAIMDGTLPAGSRVRDHELAQQLGVSRMPVREALQRLQRVGLIETAASRYTRVTEVTPELAEGTRRFAGHYTVSLVRMALAGMSPGDRASVAQRIDQIVERLENGASELTSRRELHLLLLEACANPFMDIMSSDVSIAIQRNLAGASLPLDDAQQLADNYRALSAAFTAGDADAAERIARAQFGITGE